MKRILSALIFVLSTVSFLGVCAQPKEPQYNFDYERIDPATKAPAALINWGSGYNTTVDSTEKISGKYSIKIQPSAARAVGSFSAPAYEIPAMYKGKEIGFSAYLKLQDVEDGLASLFIRIDGSTGTLGYQNIDAQKIKGTSDWKKYSVKLPLPEAAKNIYVAVVHSGTGIVWADKLNVSFDGKGISQAEKREVKVYAAELDKEFQKGSGITALTLTPQKVNDLALTAKVWGFLKYYHPKVAAGDLNWDYELFRILPKIIESNSAQERNGHLLAWVNGLSQVSGNSKSKWPADAKLSPDLGWIDDKQLLGPDLSAKLSAIQNAGRKSEHYYIDVAPGVGNPVFKNEDSYASMEYPDQGYRLLSLFRYWNMIQYFFPYKHLIGEDWNKVLPEFIPTFADASDQKEYVLANLELIARIHDTHANVWGNPFLEMKVKGSKRVPFQSKFIEDKLVVTGYYSDTLAIKDQVKRGDIITSINGRSVAELVKKNLPLTPASNYDTQLRDLGRNLLRTNDSTVRIELLRDNKALTIIVPALQKGLNTSLDYMSYPNKPAFEVQDNIAYVFPGKYKNADLPAMKEKFKSTRGMIIDMRCYPSEFMPFNFGEYLKDRPSSFVKFTAVDLQHPGLFKFGPEVKNGDIRGEKYKGKIVIIVDAVTQSQAEYTTMAFQGIPNVTVIGSTTAAADGNVSRISLPGGISTMISGIGVYYPDGSETQRVGVKIDVPIKPTIKGIKEGRDELLDKARELVLAN